MHVTSEGVHSFSCFFSAAGGQDLWPGQPASLQHLLGVLLL